MIVICEPTVCEKLNEAINDAQSRRKEIKKIFLDPKESKDFRAQKRIPTPRPYITSGLRRKPNIQDEGIEDIVKYRGFSIVLTDIYGEYPEDF